MEDENEDTLEERLKQKAIKSRGRLTDRLMAEGLLTPSMLNQLKKEWQQVGWQPD